MSYANVKVYDYGEWGWMSRGVPQPSHCIAVECDDCGKTLFGNAEDLFRSVDEAESTATYCGWHQYDQPDGDPRHICPECVEKEDKHDS